MNGDAERCIAERLLIENLERRQFGSTLPNCRNLILLVVRRAFHGQESSSFF